MRYSINQTSPSNLSYPHPQYYYNPNEIHQQDTNSSDDLLAHGDPSHNDDINQMPPPTSIFSSSANPSPDFS